MSARVLIVGNEDTLLATRKMIVQRHFEAVSSHPDQALDLLGSQHFDLVLLCHSVRPVQSRELIKVIHRTQPLAGVVLIARLDTPHREYSIVDRVVESNSAPRDWVDAIKKLLGSMSLPARSLNTTDSL